jgi:hypothetical protein
MRLHVENCGPQPVAVKGDGAEGLQFILGVGETWEPICMDGQRAYVRPVTVGWDWHELPVDLDGTVEFQTPMPAGILLAKVSVCARDVWELKTS